MFNKLFEIDERNGVDYSDIIARKQELGYTGPGYSNLNFNLKFTI